MNPAIQQITLEEKLENFADEIAEDIYQKFDEYHNETLKMTRYQAAMIFCKYLKASLYMKLINTKIPVENPSDKTSETEAV